MIRSRRRLAALCAFAALVIGYGLLPDWWGPPRPRGFPAMVVPAHNLLSRDKAALGRLLFHDRRLSVNGTVACADCHQQRHGFADTRAKSSGALGEPTRRNAMSLTNAAYNGRLTWADDRIDSLEAQAVVPLTLEHPLEMGFARDADGILKRLRADQDLLARFKAVFPDQAEALTLNTIVLAISSFERLLVSGDSPYDRYMAGELTALSASAQRGLELFNSERLHCTGCHGGFNFRFSPGHRKADEDRSVAYHNTGLYNVDGNGAYPADDRGLIEISGQAQDMGRFKAPTLRNIEVTAPYMHDGSMASLEEVIDHYSRGGRLLSAAPVAGDGRLNPFKSPLVAGFTLSAEEKQDLLAFLKSLTDSHFLHDPELGPPPVR